MKLSVRSGLALTAACVLGILAFGFSNVIVALRVATAPSGIKVSKVTHANGPLKVLVLGDSLAYGYGASVKEKSFVSLLGRRLRKARPGSEIINLSYPGAATATLFEQLDRAPRQGIAVVMLIAGANDIRRLTFPLELSKQERALLSSVHRQYPRAPILVSNIPDVSRRYFSVPLLHRRGSIFAPFQMPLRSLIELDAGLQNDVSARCGATIVDLHGASQRRGADNPSYISGDGLHPSDAGHAELARYIWPILAKATGLTGKPV